MSNCTELTAHCSLPSLHKALLFSHLINRLLADLRLSDMMALHLADGSHIQCHRLGLNELLLPASWYHPHRNHHRHPHPNHCYRYQGFNMNPNPMTNTQTFTASKRILRADKKTAASKFLSPWGNTTPETCTWTVNFRKIRIFHPAVSVCDCACRPGWSHPGNVCQWAPMSTHHILSFSSPVLQQSIIKSPPKAVFSWYLAGGLFILLEACLNDIY